jgi:hypothetical protein
MDLKKTSDSAWCALGRRVSDPADRASKPSCPASVLPKHLPVLSVPGIVERFHPLQILFSAHGSPLVLYVIR